MEYTYFSENNAIKTAKYSKEIEPQSDLGREQELKNKVELQKKDLSLLERCYNEISTTIINLVDDKILGSMNKKDGKKLLNLMNSVSDLNVSFNDKSTIVVKNFSHCSDGLLLKDEIEENQGKLAEMEEKLKKLENIKNQIEILMKSEVGKQKQRFKVWEDIHYKRRNMLEGRFKGSKPEQIDASCTLSLESYWRRLDRDNKRIKKTIAFQMKINERLGRLQSECTDLEDELLSYNKQKKLMDERNQLVSGSNPQDASQVKLTEHGQSESDVSFLQTITFHFHNIEKISGEYIKLLQKYPGYLENVPKIVTDHVNRVLLVETAEERISEVQKKIQEHLNACKKLIQLHSKMLEQPNEVKSCFIAKKDLAQGFAAKINENHWANREIEQVFNNKNKNIEFLLNSEDIEKISKDFRESVRKMEPLDLSPLFELQEERNLVGPYEHIHAWKSIVDQFPAFCKALDGHQDYIGDLEDYSSISPKDEQELLKNIESFLSLLREWCRYALSVEGSNNFIMEKMETNTDSVDHITESIKDFYKPAYEEKLLGEAMEIFFDCLSERFNGIKTNIQAKKYEQLKLEISEYSDILEPMCMYFLLLDPMIEHIDQEVNKFVPHELRFLWQEIEERKKERGKNPLVESCRFSSILDSFVKNNSIFDD